MPPASQSALRPSKESRQWIAERITAILLIPLTPWMALSLAALPDASYAACVAWIVEPLHFVPLLAFLLISVWHTLLGLESVIIDYVQQRVIMRLSLWAIKLSLLGVLVTAGTAVFMLIRKG